MANKHMKDILFFLLLCLVSVILGSYQQKVLYRLKSRTFSPFQKMVFDSNAMVAYISSKNCIHQLNLKSETLLQSVCLREQEPIPECSEQASSPGDLDLKQDAYNKILTLTSSNYILSCWNESQCYFVSTENVSNVFSGQYKSSFGFLKLERKIFVVEEKDYLLLVGDADSKSNRFLAYTDIKNEKLLKMSDFKTFELTLNTGNTIDVRGIYSMNKFTYFLSEISSTSPENKQSKISKICRDNSKHPIPYEDMEINCVYQGEIYSRLVLAKSIFVNNKKVLLAVFKSNNENSASVVCVYKEQEILKQFLESRNDKCHGKTATMKNYLDDRSFNIDLLENCLSVTNETDFCPDDPTRSFTPILAPGNLSKDAIIMENVGFTAFLAVSRHNNTELWFGTDGGRLKKAWLKSTEEATILNNTRQLIESHGTVLDIQESGNTIIILSEHLVTSLTMPICSQAESRKDCLSLGTVFCGWCLFDNKCTSSANECLFGDAQGAWLSSVVQMDFTLKFEPGIPSGASVHKEIVVEPPIDFTLLKGLNVTFGCSYDKNKGKTVELIDGECFLPPLYGPKTIQLSLIAKYNGSDTIVASKDLHIYDCDQFNTCKECTSTSYAACYWDATSAVCQTGGSGSGSKCPVVAELENSYIPQNYNHSVFVLGSNFPNESWDYLCNIGEQTVSGIYLSSSTISCHILLSKEAGKVNFSLSYKGKNIDADAEQSFLEVYNCSDLQCSICNSRKSEYMCHWSGSACVYNQSGLKNDDCPAPVVIDAFPATGLSEGGTTLTILGENFGDDVENISIKVSSSECNNLTLKLGLKYDNITCLMSSGTANEVHNLTISRGQHLTESNKTFRFLKPVVKKITPDKAIVAGKTNITIIGENILIGKFSNFFLGQMDPESSLVECEKIQRLEQDSVHCHTPAFKKIGKTDLIIQYESNMTEKFLNILEVVANPTLSTICPLKSIKSGGTRLTIKGTGFSYVTSIRIEEKSFNYHESVNSFLQTRNKTCERISDQEVICKTPVLPGDVTKRSVDAIIIKEVTIWFDGFETSPYSIEYYPDPSFERKLSYSNTTRTLYIKGTYLLDGITLSDYEVTLDNYTCTLPSINSTTIACHVPANLPPKIYSVKVKVGDLDKFINILRIEPGPTQNNNFIYYIIGIVVAVLLLLVVLFILFVFRIRSKNKKFVIQRENEIQMLTQTIQDTCREEFDSLSTNMGNIKSSMMQHGILYHIYQRYAEKTLFPYTRVDHSSDVPQNFQTHEKYFHDPTDELWQKTDLKRNDLFGKFEDLFFEKHFLCVVIRVLEKQSESKFSFIERSEFSSLISVLLLGKMYPFYEVLEFSMQTHVQNNKKVSKLLFRKSSILQKLFYNWLSLALYPYLKEGGGNALFLLYKAIQVTMSSKPIDAITNEAVATLADSRLLLIEDHSTPIDLTIKIQDVHEYPVTVLDCDTISQVKEKIFHEIYSNTGFQQHRLLSPKHLHLDWFAGKHTKITLTDIDRISQRGNGMVKLNTVKDYNLQKNSNLHLTQDNNDEEDMYVNCTSQEDQGEGVSEVLIQTNDMDNLANQTKYHLVKPSLEDNEKQSKTKVLPELYFMRLQKTRLSLLTNINEFFGSILDAKNTPKLLRYIWKRFDEIADENGIDLEVSKGWKSDSYGLRLWSNWICKPEMIFDIYKSEYVDPSLDVIKDVLVDVFSQESATKSNKIKSKDLPPTKVLFQQEVKRFQQDVSNFYKALHGVESVDESDFRETCQEISNLQQKIRVKKKDVLIHLFRLLQSFREDITEQLNENNETRLSADFEKIMDKLGEEISLKERSGGNLYSRF